MRNESLLNATIIRDIVTMVLGSDEETGRERERKRGKVNFYTQVYIILKFIEIVHMTGEYSAFF